MRAAQQEQETDTGATNEMPSLDLLQVCSITKHTHQHAVHLHNKQSVLTRCCGYGCNTFLFRCLQDKQGNTALHLAASFRQNGVVKLLLSQPSHAAASTHKQALALSANRAGMLPIHAAAISGCSTCCSMCYLAASNTAGDNVLTAKDKKGLTAADMATKHGHQASWRNIYWEMA